MICTTVIENNCEPLIVVTAAGPPGPAGADGTAGDVASNTVMSAVGEIVVFVTIGGKTIGRSNVLLSALATVVQLNNKVDKVPGFGLSENSFSNAYKAILDGYIPGTFVGYFDDETALNAAFPTAVDGSYAILRDVGVDASVAVWDELNTVWVNIQKAPVTSAEIQAALATDANWNLFSDIYKAKVDDSVDTSTFNAAIAAFSGGTAFANVITEPTTARNLAGTDAGAYLRFTNPAGCDIFVPNNGTTPLPGFPEFRFRRTTSAGPITLTLDAGVTVNGAASIASLLADGNVSLKKVANDEFDLVLNF